MPNPGDITLLLQMAGDGDRAAAEGVCATRGHCLRIYSFLGCTFDETADILQVSATEVKRLMRKAQMWLQRELKGYEHDS